MAVIQYFAYGSNMLTERLQARCASAKARVVACADDWALTFPKEAGTGQGRQRFLQLPAVGCSVLSLIWTKANCRSWIGLKVQEKDTIERTIPGSHRRFPRAT